MSSEERRKILQMVADGKISAEEAATLMRALDDDAEAETASAEPEVIEVGPGFGGERSEAPELETVRRRAGRFSGAFLWIGILFTVLSAWAMFGIQQNAGLNFWFYCMSMPLMLGIVLIALGAKSKTSRWLYVNVDRTQSKDTDGPRKISLAFPLPLGFASWFIRTFGNRIDDLKDKNVDAVADTIMLAKNMTEPLVVHVDDDDDGTKVQVFIG
ncbi:MAG TPA: hypothetical protein PK078_13685 [Anaerolineales bacterium]|nr:hypothetical protein [Anaerolineales bacterium]HNC09436.1 hypothetical protein [Anaerolineales bacterium]